MELSIIIPAYNCENTICLPLDSIVKQKKITDFEVVIVNDCSDYDYDKYVKKYSKKINIREMKTPKNLGPGGARQFGIDNSSSKYIIFIDSDDYFYDETSISKMYNKIEDSDSDLVICNFIYERDNKVLVKRDDFTWLHGKIYKRKFLTDNNIRFNNSRANEDNGFNRLILLLKPKFSFLNEIVYVYKENPNSITRKNNRLYKFEGIEGFCYNMNWAIEESLKRGASTRIIGRLSLDILTTLYVYYFDLKDEYDVSKILNWAKDIYIKYKDSKLDLKKSDIDYLVEDKKIFLKEDINVKKYNFTFNTFLKKIGEV